jgi:hypothetical protein
LRESGRSVEVERGDHTWREMRRVDCIQERDDWQRKKRPGIGGDGLTDCNCKIRASGGERQDEAKEWSRAHEVPKMPHQTSSAGADESTEEMRFEPVGVDDVRTHSVDLATKPPHKGWTSDECGNDPSKNGLRTRCIVPCTVSQTSKGGRKWDKHGLAPQRSNLIEQRTKCEDADRYLRRFARLPKRPEQVEQAALGAAELGERIDEENLHATAS